MCCGGHMNMWPARLRRRLGLGWPLFLSLSMLGAVFLCGTLGYWLIEDGWSLGDGFYMVLITLATIGYGEVHPLSEAGRWLTIALILVGLGNFAWIIGCYSQAVSDGKFFRALRRRRLDKTLAGLSGHCILCGYGRIGAVVAGDLKDDGMEVVVIETDPTKQEQLENAGYLYITGDATSDDVLGRVGVERARALVTTMADDAQNVYVVLSARHMNPNLYIVSRAGENAHVRKLECAGANQVFLPHVIGGLRMALAVRRPAAAFFIEMSQNHTADTLTEEMTLSPASPLAGTTLRGCGLRQNFNVSVLAVRRADGSCRFNPSPEFVMSAGDTLLLAGDSEHIHKLKELS